MRYQYRPRSISTWAFWTALLVGSSLYLAHRLDWFPIAFLPQPTAQDEQAADLSLGKNPPAQTPPDGQIEVAQSPAGPQSEPPFDDSDQPAPSPLARSAKARLMEQRAEAEKPQLHANPATPASVEPANIDDVEVSRASFGSEAPATGRTQHSEGIVQTSHSVVQPETPTILDPKLLEWLEKIDGLVATQDLARAHRELSTIYWSKPQWRGAIRDRIEKTARAIYFDPKPHLLEPYVVQPNDEFAQFAKRYQVPGEYLAKLNHVDPKRIQPGQRLKVIQGPFGAIVELGGKLLTVHAYGYYVKTYHVGIGKDGSTPVGKFAVLNKVTNPQYTDPQGRVVGSDDPENPLGERWIDLGGGYGIHGTLDPDSIGRAESRGCIRMRNQDVAEVFDMLTVGSEVAIRR